MLVVRSILLALAAVACAAAAAAAEECTPAAIRDTYRQAEAAYARKDFAAAAARFRPLAEQGLGPAQLRLGQIVAAGPGTPDLIEAYRWIALAAQIGVPGADPELAALTARIGPAQIAQAGFAPASWQPPHLGACLSVDPRVTRPDGAPGYDFDRLVNHLGKVPSATGPEALRHEWLMRNLEAVRTGSPRYLIYFKALYGITFVGGPGPFATTAQQGDLPTVRLNESYMDKISIELLTQMVSASIYGVHATLMPQAVAPHLAAANSETYKGYTIQTTSDEDGRRFVEFVKYAIDMTDQLPPDLLKLARAVTDLRYEPHAPFDNRGGAIALASYRHDSKTGRAYEGYGENFSMRGPAHIVITLVDAGVRQRREQAGGKAATHDPAHGDCEIEDYEIKTAEALKVDPLEINRRYKARIARGCG